MHAVAHARQSQEGDLVVAVGVPVGQNVFGVAAELDDRLLVGHAAQVAGGVAQLIDADDLVKDLHRLFVALELAVTGHTIADEVSQQGDNGTGAFLVLLQLRDALNHGVGAVPHEAVHEGVNAGLLPQVALPKGQLLLGQGREIGHCHFASLSER